MIAEAYEKKKDNNMSIFDETLADIRNKKKNRENGAFNGIPMPFPRYREYVSSIEKGMFYSIVGSTGTGKSKLIRYMFIYETMKFSMQNDYPVKILYFALEDGKKLIYKKIISHYLWERHGIIVPVKYLDSLDDPLSNEYLSIIERDKEFFEKFNDSVYIIDDRTSASEIYKACCEAHEKFGQTHHIISIIDNYSNITREQGQLSEWEAINILTKKYIRLDLCKKKNMTVVGVIQLDMESEKHSFRNAAKGTISSLEPNLGSLGDNKTVARSHFVMWALFNPWRYEIERYPFNDENKCWRTDILRNKFRSLIMLKNNNGDAAPRFGLYFDGVKETFSEMPLMTDQESLKKIYDNILREAEEKQRKLF